MYLPSSDYSSLNPSNTVVFCIRKKRETQGDFFEAWEKTTVEKKEKAISVSGKYNSIKTDESEADINKQNIICVEELFYKAEKDEESFRIEMPSPISQKSIVRVFLLLMTSVSNCFEKTGKHLN